MISHGFEIGHYYEIKSHFFRIPGHHCTIRSHNLEILGDRKVMRSPTFEILGNSYEIRQNIEITCHYCERTNHNFKILDHCYEKSSFFIYLVY